MSVRLTVISTGFNGAPAYNTFHGMGDTSGEAITFAANVKTLWDGLASVLANGTDVDFNGEVEFYDVTDGNTLGVQAVTPWHVDGTWGTSKAPAGTTLVLRWRTGQYVGGREIRGRSYISGLGDHGDANGEPTAAIVLDAANAAAALVAAGTLQVYSPTNGIAQEVVSSSCWTRFGLMRSRRD